MAITNMLILTARRSTFGVADSHLVRIPIQGGGPVAVVIKLPAWRVGDRRFKHHSGIHVSKKQNGYFPLIRKATARISNPVSPARQGL